MALLPTRGRPLQFSWVWERNGQNPLALFVILNKEMVYKNLDFWLVVYIKFLARLPCGLEVPPYYALLLHEDLKTLLQPNHLWTKAAPKLSLQRRHCLTVWKAVHPSSLSVIFVSSHNVCSIHFLSSKWPLNSELGKNFHIKQHMDTH